jgi:acyl phosphate:glycerol-3-phosphate acyltransferase
MNGTDALVWFLISFFCGSLPFSVWIGRWILKKDIRQYGDKNPGTANVFRAGGRIWGVVALLLDFLKGAIPVGLAYWKYDMDGWGLALIAIAPVFGHAYSPLLGFHGGKALATTFGIWTGLTLWQAPMVLGLNLAFWDGILATEGWVILFGVLGFLTFLLLSNAPVYLVTLGIVNGGLLVWNYRSAFLYKPTVRKWLTRLVKWK